MLIVQHHSPNHSLHINHILFHTSTSLSSSLLILQWWNGWILHCSNKQRIQTEIIISSHYSHTHHHYNHIIPHRLLTTTYPITTPPSQFIFQGFNGWIVIQLSARTTQTAIYKFLYITGFNAKFLQILQLETPSRTHLYFKWFNV